MPGHFPLVFWPYPLPSLWGSPPQWDVFPGSWGWWYTSGSSLRTCCLFPNQRWSIPKKMPSSHLYQHASLPAVMRSIVLIPPGLGHVFLSLHKVWVTVTLVHFCQGCVPCVRGPWIRWENPHFNSTFGTDNLDFNKTKIEDIVGTQ